MKLMVHKAEPGPETAVGKAADREGYTRQDYPLSLEPWQTHGGAAGPLPAQLGGVREGEAARPRWETQPPRLGQPLLLLLPLRALWPQPYLVKEP